MAETKMIFPIGFDLDEAVKKAGQEWNSSYADKLEKLLAKRPINVRLQLDVKSITDLTAKVSGISGLSPKVTPKIDTSSFEGALKRLQASLQAVDYGSLTDDEASAIATLTKAVNSLARAYAEKNKAAALEDRTTQELKAATAAEKRAKAELATAKAIEQRGKKEANVAIAKANQTKAEENAAAAARRRASAEEALVAAQNRRKKSENDLAASTARMEKAQLSLANAQNKAANATRDVNKAFGNQSTYLSRLIQRMAVYASVSTLGSFLSNIREITAQFELQRVSLGAIIQDQNRANALFNQVKGLALESPFKLLDLTKYTKQLAAYQIETDELFDTMKRLADVSAGLGVSMDRLILAYGQVRATGHLRASEIRQFTEAGLPIVDQLAKKLSAANGELVRAKDVMDMVSSRQIPFEMVAEVFEDMTEKGGLFFDMQKKQGETLYGMWQKLGDAASIMFNEIGTSDIVNKGMKTMIELLTDLMRNWKSLAAAMAPVAIAAVRVLLTMQSTRLATRANTKANIAYVASLRSKVMALNSESIALARLTPMQRMQTRVNLMAARAQLAAATSTNVFARALHSLRAAMLSNPWTLIITAVASLVAYFATATDETEKLAESLSEIDDKYNNISRESAQNLPKLAEEAVNAADGTKKQKDALDELSRTYGNIIPQELLTIENLRSMKGEYAGLVALVDEYNTKRKYEERKSVIDQSYQTQVKEAENNLKDWLNAMGVDNTSPVQNEIVQKIRDKVNEGIDAVEATNAVLQEYSGFLQNHGWNMLNLTHWEKLADAWEADFNMDEVYEFGNAIAAYNNALSENDTRMQAEIDSLNKYADNVDKAKRAVEAATENPLAFNLMLRYDIPDDAEISEHLKEFAEGKIDSFIVDKVKFNEYTAQLKEVEEEINALKRAKNELGAAFPIADERRLKHAQLQVENLNYLRDYLVITQETVNSFDWTNLAPSEQMQQLTDERLRYIKTQVENMFTEAGLQIPQGWAKNVYGQWRVNFDMLLKLAANDPQLQASIIEIRGLWEQLAPTDTIMQIAHKTVRSIADETGMSVQAMQSSLKKSGESWEEYAKRVKEAVEDVILAKIAALRGEIRDLEKDLGDAPEENWVMPVAGELRERRKELEQYEKDLKGVAKIREYAEDHVYQSGKSGGKRTGRGSGGTKKDPRLQNLKEEISLVQKLYNEYKQLEKQEGASKAAADMRKMAEATIDMFKNKYGFDLPTDAKDLTSALEILYAKMAALPKKVFPSLDKDLKEMRWTIEKINIDESQREIEAQLKELADRISRTKTAREFYDKVLGATGDVELATNVSLSIYGQNGEDLFNDTVKQIREVFKSGKADVIIDVDAAIDTANQRIDYKMLADIYEKYQDAIIEKNRDTANKIVQEGQKTIATNILNWQKELSKAKSFEEQRTEIIKHESERRANIIKENRDPKSRSQQVSLSYDKQAQALAKLAVDEFKSSDDYIKVFQDLDRVSTQTLERMTQRLKEMIAVAKEGENVEGIKALVEQLEKIKDEKDTRNPIQGVIDSFKEYAKARQDFRTAEAAEAKVKAKFAQQEIGLNKAIADAKALQEAAQQRVNDLQAQGKLNSVEGVAAQLALNAATTKVTQATEKRNRAIKKVEKAEQNTTDALDAQKAAIAKLSKNVNAIANAFSSAASSIQTIADMMGVAEDSELGDIVNGLVSGLNNAATIMTTILGIAIAIESACWWLLAIGGAIAAFSAIGSWLTGSKVRKANKEIKKQQEILEQLEYTYDRLQAAADKLFGTDYINNYNKQLEALNAEQIAYQKQAEAERSKGKKADEERIKEYEEQAREAGDKILDMEDEIINRMTGTDRQDLAREWAKSWIEAKTMFESTTDAIKSKYKDMIQSMIIEGAAARIIEAVIAPMWEKADEMFRAGDVDGAIDYVISGIDQTIQAADRGMNTFWEGLRAKGYDIDEIVGNNESKASAAKGIQRDYATASEESINGLAAAVNTQNWYISHVPTIATDTHALRTFIESGYALEMVNSDKMIEMQRQALGNLQGIERHTAETVTECRRIAKECVEQTNLLGKVITGKNGASAYGVQVFMR